MEEWEASEEIGSAGGGGSGEGGRWGGGGGESTEHKARADGSQMPNRDSLIQAEKRSVRTMIVVTRLSPYRPYAGRDRRGRSDRSDEGRMGLDGQECYVESRLAGAKRRRTGKGEETGMPTGRPPGE